MQENEGSREKASKREREGEERKFKMEVRAYLYECVGVASRGAVRVLCVCAHALWTSVVTPIHLDIHVKHMHVSVSTYG